jgi:hypothetical protein
MNYSVYGIRHHGPGSAKNLLKALEEQNPDIILIEGPEDANASLRFASDKDMRPPVALLMYNPKNMRQASYFPFAIFSPEWQAIHYGFRKDVPVRLIDLPMSVHFARQEKKKEELTLEAESPGASRLVKDPLKVMAELAGFEEVERWWEHHFEQWDTSSAIFGALLELMQALREEAKGTESRETLLREAFMRKQLRKALKEGYKNIALVCGAWHAPVLSDLGQFPQKYDNQLLRGLKKLKAAAAWIPWSYELLAKESGYGAGVKAPEWYHLLHGDRKDISVRWMVKAAQLFRKEDLNTSAAHALEGARLANTLAVMRGRPLPGLEELREAALAVMCDGHLEKLRLIDRKLSIGQRAGRVGAKAPAVPLQKDLEAAIRSARLKKEFESAGTEEKELDLRKPTNLAASILIRRLRLLEVPWGQLKKGSPNQLGRFKEVWRLKWNPAFALRIIEAGALGNTVEEAVSRYVEKQIQETEDLEKLTSLVEDSLNADLPDVLEVLILKMSKQVALTEDVLYLVDAFSPLVEALRYGSTRKIDLEGLSEVLRSMLPRIYVGIPSACAQVKEELSRELFEKLLRLNHSISILQWQEEEKGWEQTLQRMERFPGLSPLVKGFAVRLLFDRDLLDEKQVARKMSFALSNVGFQAPQAAHWLEGFLSNSALLLIHSPPLWNLLHQWIDELELAGFQEVLPILRRIFSAFPAPERARVLELAKKGYAEQKKAQADDIHTDWAERTLPVLRLLLEGKGDTK